jgi:hypothetical protein
MTTTQPTGEAEDLLAQSLRFTREKQLQTKRIEAIAGRHKESLPLLREIAPEWAQESMSTVFAPLPKLLDDAAAARLVAETGSLAVSLHDFQRGLLVSALWDRLNDTPVSVAMFRAALESVWMHNHDEVIVAAGSRKTLADMFSKMKPDLSRWPETLTVWRGAAGLSEEQVRRGLSWSTDRDKAAWFALHHSSERRLPVLLKAEVSRQDIAWYTNDRKESEVVIIDGLRNVEVDGDVADWREAADRECASRALDLGSTELAA